MQGPRGVLGLKKGREGKIFKQSTQISANFLKFSIMTVVIGYNLIKFTADFQSKFLRIFCYI